MMTFVVRLISRKSFWLVLLVQLLGGRWESSTINAIPMQVVVTHNTNECLFEQLNAGESVTLSTFILAGSELRASVLFDGPLPEPSNGEGINSGAALQQAIRNMELGINMHNLFQHNNEPVDFEHLNIGEDDEYKLDEEDKPNNEEGEDENAEQRRERRNNQRKKSLEARQRQEQRKVQQRQKVRHEGEPHQRTFKAHAKGWYRYCVQATWNQVTAEMDMRKESEMGGLDENGHVRTVAQKVVREEEIFMEEDTAAKEGIKDEDFQSTRNKLKELRHLLADIQSKQAQERHRIAVHSVTNEHTHSRAVLGSLLETILFMVVTGYQVYTIRKWFKGAPVLAR